MPSPFPGMNPYLEHPAIWEDFHASLAIEIRRQLTPKLHPKYVATLMPHITYEEIGIGEPSQTVKPDVAILWPSQQPSPTKDTELSPSASIITAPLLTEAIQPEPIKLYTLEVRHVASQQLVTSIEILSPVNKRRGHPAFLKYQKKRADLPAEGVHLLEIDLLREGSRFPVRAILPPAPYFVFLQRAETVQVEVWPVTVSTPIPITAVPLLPPDPDIPLNLNQAIHTIYDEAAYELRIDYRQEITAPKLSPKEMAWIDEYLTAQKLR